MIPAHVHVLTTLNERDPVGCAVAWVTQASAERVLVSLGARSAALAAAQASGRFALSSLAEGQEAVAQRLGSGDLVGPASFAGLMTVPMANGCAAIAGSVQALGCEVERHIELDGRVLLIGRIREHRPLHAHRAPLRLDWMPVPAAARGRAATSGLPA